MVDIKLNAAADFLGNGAIETNRYESEIVDIVRRESVALQRLPMVPATGAPHRYFEQLAVASATAGDPRNIAPTASGPTRVERSVLIKQISGQSNFSLFDVDVTRQQGQFSRQEAKDVEDITSGIVLKSAAMVWAGADTSLTAQTSFEYVGLLTQITQTSTIVAGSSIIDGLKSQVATMVANVTFRVKPTAIYINPKLGDYIDREVKAEKISLQNMIVGGTSCNAISTQAGVLPLIPEVFVPSTTDTSYGFSAPPSGYRNYFAVIVTEPMIEMPYVAGADGNKLPRIFQLGLVGGLQGQYVGVWFNSIVAKGANYAHAVVAIVRP